MGAFQPGAWLAKLPPMTAMPLSAQAILAALAILVGAWVVGRLVRLGLARARRRIGGDQATGFYLAERVSGYVIIGVGILAAISALGVDLTSLSIFAGALGVGIGLGLQEIVKNFFSGLVLLMDKSIEVGDFIELEGGAAGEVRSVGARATMITNNDHVDILIPNSLLLENRLTNWTRERHTRRVHVPFRVAFGVDKERVRAAALEAARAVPFTLPDDGDRRAQVWLVGFGEYGLNFELVVWPSLEAVKRPGAMMAAYAWAIEDALRRHGLDIPYPQLDVHAQAVVAHQPPARRPAASPTNDAAEELAASAAEERSRVG